MDNDLFVLKGDQGFGGGEERGKMQSSGKGITWGTRAANASAGLVGGEASRGDGAARAVRISRHCTRLGQNKSNSRIGDNHK